MVEQPDLILGNSEIGVVLLSTLIIFIFTGKKIWKHYTNPET